MKACQKSCLKEQWKDMCVFDNYWQEHIRNNSIYTTMFTIDTWIGMCCRNYVQTCPLNNECPECQVTHCVLIYSLYIADHDLISLASCKQILHGVLLVLLLFQ